MKKKQLLIFVTVFLMIIISTASDLFAKGKRRGGGNLAFRKRNMVISLGYGAPNLAKDLFKPFQTYGGYSLSGIGPAHAKFEYAISDNIGLGLSINYVQMKTEWSSSYPDPNNFLNTITYKEGFKGSSLSANLRMNIHFLTSAKIDPYWGIGLGYRTSNYSFYSDYTGATALTLVLPSLPLGFETTVGIRYYFTKNIGAYLELGASKSIIQGGLAIKL